MLEFEPMKEQFRQYLILKGYAPGTQERYLYSLQVFGRFMAEREVRDLALVTREVVRDFQESVHEGLNGHGEPTTATTQNAMMRGMKFFFRYLRQENYLIGDPAEGVSYSKEPHKLPRSMLTAGEMRKILKGPDTQTWMGYRDRTILEVLYSTGLRSDELNGLQVPDVDYEGGFIRVNCGKGGRDRVVPVGKIACRYLENYIKAVRPHFLKDPANPHLFLTIRGTRMHKNVLLQTVKRNVRKAKLEKRVTPHTFRHTCATLMMRNKANIRHIQELLGHASLETTQVYTAVTVADLKEVHQKCHPRERGQ
jgi:integrase/recombinase XerD